jgi:hypothetical protein
VSNFQPRASPRTGRDVWTKPGLPGHLDSTQAAGGFAAPLLATASFALVALVLQANPSFTRWPDLALLCFIGAGLAQVFAVQCVVWTRRYMTTPDELRQWLPDDFSSPGERPTAWLLEYQRDHQAQAQAWARRTALWINVGVSLLLAGIAVSVVPPGHIGEARVAVIVVADAGVAVEASWVATMGMRGDSLRRTFRTRLAEIAICGAALAAAALAGLATGTGFPVAAWWAISLAAVTVAPRLGALCGLRLRYGRLWYRRPSAGWRGTLRGIGTLLPPVTFVLAVKSAARLLARERNGRLQAAHPGIDQLLPRGVTLRAHHRALARCVAVAPAVDQLGELLKESGSELGDGQPTPEALADRVRRAPDCVLTVIDRHDWQTRFGYFIVYPLRESAVHRIRRGEIGAGRELTSADLVPSAEASAGSYVSVIWAPGEKWTRQCVIATLVEWLAAADWYDAPRPVFGRPANARGQALMQEYGFHPITAQDGVWEWRGLPDP